MFTRHNYIEFNEGEHNSQQVTCESSEFTRIP